jgi:hypothetical protein
MQVRMGGASIALGVFLDNLCHEGVEFGLPTDRSATSNQRGKVYDRYR